MASTLRGWLLAASLLMVSCSSVPQEQTPPVSQTRATITVLNLPGQDALCQNLLDVNFSIANADIEGDRYGYGSGLNSHASFNVDQHSAFLLERIDFHRRNTFSDQEYQQVQERLSNVSIMSVIGDSPALDRDPLMKRFRTFIRTLVEPISPTEYAERDPAKQTVRQRYLWDLDAREDTQFEPATSSFVTNNDQFKQHYVRQTTDETCYAASLLTVWRYFGWQANYDDFVEQRIPHCSLSVGRRVSASFNEIISTVYHLRSGDNAPLFSWTGSEHDRAALVKGEFSQVLSHGSLLPSFGGAFVHLGNQPPQQLLNGVEFHGSLLDANLSNGPNLFQLHRWQHASGSGHVVPLNHTGHLVSTLLAGDALLAGLKTRNGGHTVLVTGAEYEPQLYMDDGAPVFTASTKLRRVRVLDPGPLVSPEYWIDVDQFLAELRFGIVIHQDRAPAVSEHSPAR